MQLLVHEVNRTQTLSIQDGQGHIETITCTDEHPFYVAGTGWVAAKDLQSGTELTTPDGGAAVVVGNEAHLLDKPIIVYNFEVEGDHTYFVEDKAGGEAVWVHNTCDLAKAINLPSWKKVAIDMEHVLSGHKVGGSRVSSLKTLFPSSWTDRQIEKAIMDAYRHSKRWATQGDRVLLRGSSGGFDFEIWLNRVRKIIETAYPL